VARDAVDAPVHIVLLVSGGVCHLLPFRVSTLVTLLTRRVFDLSVAFNLLVALEDEIAQLAGAGQQTLMMAAMAADFGVCAAGPAVPGLLHYMAGLAETGVVLHVVPEEHEPVDTEDNTDHQDKSNRYASLPG